MNKYMEIEPFSITAIVTLVLFGFKLDMMDHGNGLVWQKLVVKLCLMFV